MVAKSLLRVTLIVVLTCFGLASPSAASGRRPTCYGASCESLNPAVTDCIDDAITIYHADVKSAGSNWGNMELRYSEKCHSNWVRFTPWHGLQAVGDYVTGGLVEGTPWIWRYGVDGSLRGKIDSATGYLSPLALGHTNWTEMVTADGMTCEIGRAHV